MSNQVLALHRVSHRCYDLTGVRTGSVRDQLLRSTMVVNALASSGVIRVGFPLLIFGAGAAGMNAAMLAAARRVDVTVVELRRSLFSGISGCTLRRIDPTEYDWPHEHWKTARFPMVGSIPLPQGGATSGAALAASFTTRWRSFRKSRNGRNGFGTVTVLRRLDAHALVESDLPANPFLEVSGKWGARHASTQTRRFGARLSCIGHGTELVGEMPLHGMWQGYAGPSFWTDNDGIYANAPLPAGVSKVVISGAGDGGMQDLQRAATSLFGRQLYEQLEAAARTNPMPKIDILPTQAMITAVMSAEEGARRAFVWAPSRNSAPYTLAKWHGTFRQAVEHMVHAWPNQVANHVAKALFRPEFFHWDPQIRITWVMRDATPGYAYALNRYLSLLLCTLADRLFPGRIEVYPLSSLHTIRPVGHSCTSAATCVGKHHIVEIDHGGQGQTTRDAGLIIIRHGIEPGRPTAGAPVPEQMTPFDLPH